jgi:hypothetical protein
MSDAPKHLQPYEIRSSEWNSVARALEREFPERAWASGQKLTEVSPWGCCNEDNAIALYEVQQQGRKCYACTTLTGQVFRIMWVPSINPDHSHGWQEVKKADEFGPMVDVTKYRPRNQLNALEF